MIRFYVDNGKIKLSVTKIANFHTFINLCRKLFLKYDPIQKSYIIPPFKFETTYEAMAEIDEVEGYKTVNEYVRKSLFPSSEIEFVRRELDPALLRVPPIRGKAPYEDYQLIDAQRMINRNRYGLFLEQGMGKGWITIATLNHIWEDHGILKTLIITTGSGVYTFKKELEKFAVGLDMNRVVIGDKNNRKPFNEDVDVVICSYRSFLLISDHYYKNLKNQDYVGKNYRKPTITFGDWIEGKGILVLDESHSAANMQARQTKAIHIHAPFFHYRYLLSGTPADVPEKWYSQLKILDPVLVKGQDYWTWTQEMAVLGNRFSHYAIQSFKPDKLKELYEKIIAVSSRRFVNDCLELPEHFCKKLYVSLDAFHREIYEGFVEYYINTMFVSGDGGIKMKDALAQFQHLILSVDNPELLKNHFILDENLEKKIIKFDFKKDHSKIDTMFELIREHDKEQIIVWTSHPSVGDHLEQLFQEKNITVAKIHGECIPKVMTPDEFKQSIIEDFKAGKYRVLIAATQMLTTSVTMTNACIQIFFDRTFNYVEFSQARCRIYRIGQARPVYSYILIADHTLDVTRDRRLEDKNFFDREFLTKDYVTKKIVREMFNPE